MPLLTAKLDSGVKQIGKQAMRTVLRESLRVSGRYWQRYMLPGHFTRAAYNTYGYTPRSGDPGSGHAFLGSYQWKKLQGYKNSEGLASTHSTRPLVYTGRSEQSGKRGKVTPRAQSSGHGYVDISIPAPALNFKPAGSKVDMRAEVTRVTPAEEKKLEEIMARDIEKRVERILARA